MAKKNAQTENINHFHSLRLRVLGSGNLKLSINTLDTTVSKNLADIPMTATARIEPFRIINFVSQRASITIKTIDFNAQFKINKLIIFIKPIATQYPA